MKHLLSIRDLTAADLQWILSASEQPYPRVLEGKGVALYFEKPSSRTRNSMELAVAQLGGHPVYLQPAELGIGTRDAECAAPYQLYRRQDACARDPRHPRPARAGRETSLQFAELRGLPFRQRVHRQRHWHHDRRLIK